MGGPRRDTGLGSRRTPGAPSRAPGVTPITRAGGKEVYQVAFSYRGVQCRELIALPHTRANLTYCVGLLAEVKAKIARGDFAYSDYWPDSPRARIFGQHARQRTVGEALESYRERSRATLAHSTWAAYRTDIDNRLVPHFGAMLLGELRATAVREFVEAQAGLGLKRLRNLMLPLRAVCDEAVADGLLAVNPVAALKLPRLLPPAQRTSTYAPNPYSEAELHLLLARLQGAECAAFALWAYTGMRTGELAGLRRESVDLQAGTVRVVETTTRGQDKTGAKTAAGIRTITLLPAALAAARVLMAEPGEPRDRLARNARSTLADKAWRENKLASTWALAHRGTGVTPRNPYQLRHTFASNLLSQGANVADIAARLGHANTEMVVRNYGRWVGGAAGIRWDDPAAGYGRENAVRALHAFFTRENGRSRKRGP